VGLWRDHVLPRCVARAMAGDDVATERRKCVPRARGRVLEVGFGAGLNLPHYDAARVDEVLAVEPALVNQKLAAAAVAAAAFPVRFVGRAGEELPLDDASVDCVVSTWTLCTIADPTRALAEMRRVLRPDGELLFLEHGRAQDERTARWQRRLDPLQKVWAGGCHLSRPIDELVRGAGFALDELERYTMKGPRIFCSMYLGRGRPHA
jgi:ubiquinone/menaquinone biosynthesis C-methylase UbiE